MSWSVEEELRRTPTWRAKCQMWGSGKPLRFEHLGAHEDLPLPIHILASLRSQGLTLRTHNTRDARFILVRATIVV